MRCGTASIRLSFRSWWLRTYDSAAHWDNTGRLVAVAYGSLSTVGPKMIPYQGIISQGCICIQLMSAALRFRRSLTKSRLEVRQPSIQDTRLPAGRP